MPAPFRTALALCLFYPALAMAADSSTKYYDARFVAEIRPRAGIIHVELKLSGKQLPSKIVWRIDSKRHRSITSTDPLEIRGDTATWQPRGKTSQLNYDFVINHERSPGRFDSLLTKDWAVFRGDKMVPRSRVTAARGLESRTTLEFVLPQEWSVVTAYVADAADKPLLVDDPRRRFDRPEGWMIAGKLGVRVEVIAGTNTLVAAPSGDRARRQDTLAFLNWNLPHLASVLPTLPSRLLIVSAGDPMWRGGLSGPASLFLHSSRPLISENRTSTLLHELMHVAMRIHADAESDWIVEGFAEFYSIEILRRSGGISARRHEEAMEKIARWGKRAPTLFASHSSGARTARAVITLQAVDEEIRALTSGRGSLDDVARQLAQQGGEVSLRRLQSAAAKVAGKPLKSLERSVLGG